MFRFLAVLSFAVCLGATSANAQRDFENGDNLAAALEAVKQSDWVTADHLAGQITSTQGQTMITWARLRAGEGDWWEYVDFLNQHPDWPGLKRLRRQGESVIKSHKQARVLCV